MFSFAIQAFDAPRSLGVEIGSIGLPGGFRAQGLPARRNQDAPVWPDLH